MFKYETIIYWSEDDQAYLVEVPELPGCLAHGDSYEEALANIKRLFSFGLIPLMNLVMLFQRQKGAD